MVVNLKKEKESAQYLSYLSGEVQHDGCIEDFLVPLEIGEERAEGNELGDQHHPSPHADSVESNDVRVVYPGHDYALLQKLFAGFWRRRLIVEYFDGHVVSILVILWLPESLKKLR